MNFTGFFISASSIHVIEVPSYFHISVFKEPAELEMSCFSLLKHDILNYWFVSPVLFPSKWIKCFDDIGSKETDLFLISTVISKYGYFYMDIFIFPSVGDISIWISIYSGYFNMGEYLNIGKGIFKYSSGIFKYRSEIHILSCLLSPGTYNHWMTWCFSSVFAWFIVIKFIENQWNLTSWL